MIIKSIVFLLIGIVIDKGYINDIYILIIEWIENVFGEKYDLMLYYLLIMIIGEGWKEFGNGVVFLNDFVELENWV